MKRSIALFPHFVSGTNAFKEAWQAAIAQEKRPSKDTRNVSLDRQLYPLIFRSGLIPIPTNHND